MLVHMRFLRGIAADGFKALASLRDLATFCSVVIGDDAGDVLVREGKHLRQQVVLIEVLHMVDLVQIFMIFRCQILNGVKDLFILHEARPEL